MSVTIYLYNEQVLSSTKATTATFCKIAANQ